MKEFFGKITGNKFFPIILILFEVLAVVALVLIIFKPSLVKNPFKTTSITYYQIPEYKKDLVEKQIQSALKEKDPKKAVKALRLAFDTIRFEYMLRPSNEKRESMVLIKKYLTEKYPNEIKGLTIDIPCLEVSCGAVLSTNKELMDIKQTVEESSFSAGFKENLGVLIRRAQVAFGANDKKLEFNWVYGIYSNLKNANTEKDKERVNLLLKNSQNLLKTIDSEKYYLFQVKGIFK